MQKVILSILSLVGFCFGAISSLTIPHDPIDSAAIPKIIYIDQNNDSILNKVNEIKDSVNAYISGSGAFAGTAVNSTTNLRLTVDSDANGTGHCVAITHNGTTDTIAKFCDDLASKFFGAATGTSLTLSGNASVARLNASDSVVGAHLKTAGNLIVGGTGAITGALSSGAFSATTGSFSSTLGVTGIQTNAGDLVFSSSSSVRRNSAAGFLSLSGGSTADLGANFQLFGESHGTEPGNVRFRSGTTNRLTWTESSAILALTGNQTVSGTLGVTGVSTLTGNVNVNGATNATSHGIHVLNKSISASSGSLYSFGAGDASSASNSEYIRLTHTSTLGELAVSRTTGGSFRDFVLYTSDTERYRVTAAGAHTLAGAANVTGKITGSDSVVATLGLRVGSDANLNRSGTNMLNTPDSLTVQGRLEVTGPALTTGVHTFTAAPVFNSATASQFLLLDGSKALTSVAGTGSGSVVRATSPTITTPTFSGTIASGLTASRTVVTDGSGNFAVSTETGSGNHVRATSPTISGLTLSGTTATGLTASRTLVTDGSGNMAVNTETGTGDHVRATSPTLVTPTLGVASATTIALGGNEAFDYDEGTFTATLTGVSGSVTGTARYVRAGKHVVLSLPTLTGTSTSTSCTITGLPASIQPTTAQFMPVLEVRDNGGYYQGLVGVSGSGTLSLWFRTGASGVMGSGGTFTASGTKGIETVTIPYTLQ